MSQTQKKNALADETSPYLLQHANNPVAWYPWGQIALERARREDKPILLSIGYSACHWCHVMAHESFEDEHTAKLMNRYFINIKVDREERPDLDRIYQLAHQFLTRRPGGWPLTLFLAPDDHTPFFGGTYFPDRPRHGMPAFSEILMGVAEAYRERRDDIRAQNQSVREALQTLGQDASGQGPITQAPITSAPLDAARIQLWQELDQQNGGFGQAPKFPHPTSLDYLLRQYSALTATDAPDAPDDEDAANPTADKKNVLMMAGFTLHQMANGGICDQIGGGFYRYSVDERWRIPHFEKMLYDNGLLLSLYTDIWQITENPLFQRIVFDTGDWVIREMQSPEGGYYSALDADSAGEEGKLEEGKFYIWSKEEMRELLTAAEHCVARLRFGLDSPPNMEGKWHLHIAADAERLARECDTDGESLGRLLASIRQKLFMARERRARPHRDEKILTAWNALMIKGMATAGRTLKETRFTQSAEKALAFVRQGLWRDGRLLATYKDGRAHLSAYLDDYVFMIDAILELLQDRWRNDDLDFARELAEVVLAEFEDRENGGFYFTANDHEPLIHRPKPMADEALPAGNGIAARVFNRLGHLLGEARYLMAAERTLRASWSALNRFPQAHTTLLSGVQEYLLPPQVIVLRGAGKPLRQWQERCQRHYVPGRLVFAIPVDIDTLPVTLNARAPHGDIVAYLCEGHQCREPITDFHALDKALEETEG
ncbi:MAG: thioredoxin domain-containing protein [Gammaproteobacteria bacterium]|nr:thioredoxin domain-containing protein [Gammaproteobacteria bacterium]